MYHNLFNLNKTNLISKSLKLALKSVKIQQDFINLRAYSSDFKFKQKDPLNGKSVNNKDHQDAVLKLYPKLNKEPNKLDRFLEQMSDIHFNLHDNLGFLKTSTDSPTSASKKKNTRISESPLYDKSMNLTLDQYKRLTKRLVSINRVCCTRSNGKNYSFSVMMCVGNKNGCLGYAQAQAEFLNNAIRIATLKAVKNLQFFHLYNNRTIFHYVETRFMNSKIKIYPKRPGYGLRINHVIHDMCECLGIEDISGNVYGSTNAINVAKAFVKALSLIRTPESIAKTRGINLIDLNYAYYGTTHENKEKMKI